MKVTNVRIRDLVTFFSISGILLLTAVRYVESHSCGCSLNNCIPARADASPDEVERWLRRVLRNQRNLPATQSVPFKEEKHDGC